MVRRDHSDVAPSDGESDGESDQELTEGFGGEVTGVPPDDARSSRWDEHAQDEDALLADEAPED
jgi:hypothetical protein